MSKSIGRLYGGYASQDDFNKFIEENYDTHRDIVVNNKSKEKWINVYKSKKYGDAYWTGSFGYKTKEEATKDLADRENYLTTINIEEVLKLQEENDNLKKIIGYMIDELVDYFSHDLIDEIMEALKC